MKEKPEPALLVRDFKIYARVRMAQAGYDISDTTGALVLASAEMLLEAGFTIERTAAALKHLVDIWEASEQMANAVQRATERAKK